MADMTSAPAIRACLTVECFERHQQLLEQFSHVVSEYHRMQAAQLEAVLDGEDFPFEDWIAVAAMRRDLAKYRLLAYRQAHG